MDDAGNILVRRYSKSNVYVKSTASAPNEETAIGSEVLKAPNHSLELDKVVKVRIDDKGSKLMIRNLLDMNAYEDITLLTVQRMLSLLLLNSIV